MDPRRFQRFRRHRGAMFGLVLVLGILVFAFAGPLFFGQPPNTPDFEFGRGPYGSPLGPSGRHWLGTDTLFRDLLTRLAYGGRLSLEVAFVATTIAMGIGTATGIVSGYFRGTFIRVDRGIDTMAVAAGLSVFLWHGQSAASQQGAHILSLGCFLISSGLRLASTSSRIFVGSRLHGAPSAVERKPILIFTSVELLVVATLATLTFGVSSVGFTKTLHSAGWFELGFAALFVFRLWDKRQPGFAVDVDSLLMRAVDVLLAFPFLLLLMSIGSVIERTTQATIFLVLGLTAWTGTARVIRGKTLQVRELEFVVASRALGQSTFTILIRHILPNVASAAIVLGTNTVAGMIVAEAALSFLGLSLPPPTPTWGRMLDEARPYYSAAPWMLAAPAVAILLSVLGFNLLGEGLRDAFDPKD